MGSRASLSRLQSAAASASAADVVRHDDARLTGSAVSPETYGAVGDGVTDDTTALNSAIAALVPGSTLLLRQIYRHTAVLDFSVDRVTVAGGGTLRATTQATSAVWITGDHVTVEDIRFEITGRTGRGVTLDHHKLVLHSCTGATLRRVWIQDAYGAGILAYGASDYLIDAPVVRATAADGIHNTYGSTRGLIVAPDVADTGDDGVAVVSYDGDPAPTTAIRVFDARVRNSGARGMSVVGGADVLYRGFDIDSTVAAGLIVACETSYLTRATTGVRMEQGVIRNANTGAPTLLHAAILVSNQRATRSMTDVVFRDIDVLDTDPDAIGIISLREEGGEFSEVRFEAVRDVDNAPAYLHTSPGLPTSHYSIVNYQVDGTATKRIAFSPGDSGGGVRTWARLVTVDGLNEFGGAHVQFLLAGAGDYGGASRATVLVHVNQRGVDDISAKAWAWSHGTSTDPIELYTKQISTYVFEVWAKLADYNQLHVLHVLHEAAAGSVVWQGDSFTTTAPTPISSAYAVTDYDTVLAARVPTSRQVISGTGLTGGGDLSADRTLAVAYGSAADTAVQGNDARVTADQAAATASIRTLGTGALQATAGNDARLSDARTPTAHVHSGADVTTGTVGYARLPVGTAASTVAAGDDSRITGAVPSTRSVVAGTGLTGGGTLAADRTLAVAYGSGVGTAVQGNDARVTADQAAATASIRTLGTGAQQAAAGNDARLSDARTPTAHVHAGADISSGTVAAARLPLVPGVITSQSSGAATITLDATLGTNRDITATGDLTIAVPTGGVNRQVLRGAVLASGAQRTVTFNASIRLSTGLASRAFTVASGQVLLFALEYSSLITAWVLTAATVSAT